MALFFPFIFEINRNSMKFNKFYIYVFSLF